ncbi:MAG: DNA gyrase inhibitor YacG [Pseudomonadota bacterium]
MTFPASEKTRRCPLCRKTTVADYAPFCSRGCRDRDLLAWFGENYCLPGSENDIPSGENGGEGGEDYG